MQSHQSSFGEHISSVKANGHRRRPSLGKSMPVTSLLLNFPTAPSTTRNYTSLSKDGLSPEFERPPIFFKIHETNDSTEDNDYEMLVSTNCEAQTPCSSCQSPHSDNSPLVQLCHKLCTNECSKVPAIPSTKCPSMENRKTLLRPLSTIEIQRKKFLTEMLCLRDDDDDESDSTDQQQEDVPELYEIVSNVIDKTTPPSGGCHNSSSLITPQEGAMLKDFREKFAIAEALAKTSAMTSPAVTRRLAARKVEMELEYAKNERRLNGGTAPSDSKSENGSDYEPPRDLLLYLVRMGSFNSAPKINNIDSQDDNFEIPQGLSTTDLLLHMKQLQGENPPQLLTRYFLKPCNIQSLDSNDISDGMRFLKLNSVSKVCSAPVTTSNHIRLLQWNLLSQTLGQNNDGFVRCPEDALMWNHRKFLIVEEILIHKPDIICLQEVDHYKFLENVLGSPNYAGIFFPKPDSPCLYIEENNGPDGCAIFYKCDKFNLKKFQTHILEVWHVQSNQVAIAAILEVKATGKEICVCTTHLKARHGSLLSKLRNEQGKDVLRFMKNFAENRPIIMGGDFNAEPIEPVYSTIINGDGLKLSSAYADIKKEMDTEKSNNEDVTEANKNPAELSANREPPYTTWKIREEGEVCHTIDYVFYTKDKLKVSNCLEFPQGDEIGKNRTPSYQYPSDHFSLVCDFEFLDESNVN